MQEVSGGLIHSQKFKMFDLIFASHLGDIEVDTQLACWSSARRQL